MVENLHIYKDASELIKRVFIIVKQFPRDYSDFTKRSKYGTI